MSVKPIYIEALKGSDIIKNSDQVENAEDDRSLWIDLGTTTSNTQIRRIQDSDIIRLVRLDIHDNSMVALVDIEQ